MKKSVFIYLSILLLFVSSCSTFLEEDNKGGITNDEFYSTADGYKTLVTASFSGLRTIYGETPFLDLAGTDLYQEAKAEDAINSAELTRYLTLGPDESHVEAFYTNCYNAIQSTNAGLYYNSNPTDMTDVDKLEYDGELRFLRAFYHFILIEQFGGIVISDEYTNTPKINIPRSSLEESYKFVITEMEKALSEVTASASPGRINKDVINHYLAKVYLSRGWDLGSDDDFTTAKQYADAVISSLGDITIPYDQLWDEAGENNKEFIFTVQYDLNSINNKEKDGNTQSSLYSAYGGSDGNGQKHRSENLMTAYQIHHSFQQNDNRYEYDFMWITYRQYFDYYNPDGNEKVFYYYPRIWDPNKTELTEADSALYIQEAKTLSGRNLNSPFSLFPLWRTNKDKYAKQAWGGTDARLPSFKKFDCPENDLNCTLTYSASVRDIVLARLAGTYFLKAEACIAMNKISEARNLVQKVIDRPGNKIDANGDNLTNALDNATDKQSAMEALFLEKGKEMLGEYDGRWPMLRRTKMLKYMLEKYNVDFEKNNISWQDKWNWRPIPENAITLNDGLTNSDQNPGY